MGRCGDLPSFLAPKRVDRSAPGDLGIPPTGPTARRSLPNFADEKTGRPMLRPSDSEALLSYLTAPGRDQKTGPSDTAAIG